MRKAIAIIIAVLLLVAVVWYVINKEKITVLEDGIKMQPVHLIATWDASEEVYLSPNGEEAYKECSCTSGNCISLPDDLFVVHMYVNNDGEWVQFDDIPYTEYVDLDGYLCKDAIRLPERIDSISRRFERHENDKPVFPDSPNLGEYVGHNDDTLKEIVAFFQWLGDFFLYLFDISSYLIDSLVYYFKYIQIVFEELAV